MTPLELQVLLHHHTSRSVFSPSSPVAEEGAFMLVGEGLLEQVDGYWATTERGKFYIRALLDTPFPVVSYSIPDWALNNPTIPDLQGIEVDAERGIIRFKNIAYTMQGMPLGVDKT